MMARFTFAGVVLTASLLAEESGTLAEPRTPVTRQEVWQAVAADLRGRGMAERELPRVEAIALPVALPARAGRRLRVLSACWDEAAGRTQFRLVCGEPGECLPFLVYVDNVYVDNVDVSNDDSGSSVHSGTSVAACRLPWSRRAPEVSPKPAVRAGERATAVYVAKGLRMTASVTCLERGREGDVIRVRSPDGHIFRARISGPARLEALPR
jgi:hypothetical protein